MENALIISQILFNVIVSLAIIALGISLGIAAYHLMCIAKKLHSISENVANISQETEEQIKEILEKLANLPILSLFMKKPRRK